jgi:hypothetical protein
MRAPAFAGYAVALVLTGCQWVLPIREVSDAGDSSPPSDGGGAADSSSATDTSSATEASSKDAMACDMVFTGNPQCDDCVNEMCCSEITQCFDADSACAAIQACIEKCGLNFECPSQCVNANPTGATDYEKLVECTREQPCAGICGDAG